MEHDQVRPLLSAWQAGELDTTTAAGVDAHVAGCEDADPDRAVQLAATLYNGDQGVCS